MRRFATVAVAIVAMCVPAHAGDATSAVRPTASPATASLTGLFGRRGMTQSEVALLQMLIQEIRAGRTAAAVPSASPSPAAAANGTDQMTLLLLQMLMQSIQSQSTVRTVEKPGQSSPVMVYLIQPQHQLPISGQPLQSLPIAGQPLQSLPIQGQVLQQLPIQGQPLQQLPIQGQPRQSLPVAPTMPPAAAGALGVCPDGRCPTYDYSRTTSRPKVSFASLVRDR